MNTKLVAAFEANPALGWLASATSCILGWLGWFFDHADDFAKVFGLGATILGFIAGYYTMRIQRRTWKRKQRRNYDAS